MALLFALWFLQSFVAAVERRSVGWLLVANVAGAGAGLVKVTTFLVYLVPAAAWALWWLGREWRAGTGRARLAPVVFPVLYAWHEYHLTAVAVLPMMAAGLVFRAALHTVSWRSAAMSPW